MTAESIAARFNSTAADFDAVTPLVWGPVGQSLVFALGLHTGDSVLDVCAGSGASAQPAAAAVGPDGLVHGIDLADDLLELGRVKAADRALRNVEFVAADATTWEPPSTVPSAGYDALASSFGVFFLPEMDIDFARLVRLVRPGGRIGVSVWRKGALVEFAGAFFEVVAAHSPEDPHSGPIARTNFENSPIRRIETVDTLRTWLAEAGTVDVDVIELSNHVPATEEFVWDMILGSGFRSAVASFDDDVRAAIRTEFSALLTERGIDFVDAGALVASATRAA